MTSRTKNEKNIIQPRLLILIVVGIILVAAIAVLIWFLYQWIIEHKHDVVLTVAILSGIAAFVLTIGSIPSVDRRTRTGWRDNEGFNVKRFLIGVLFIVLTYYSFKLLFLIEQNQAMIDANEKTASNTTKAN